jgi:hypothetical protein
VAIRALPLAVPLVVLLVARRAAPLAVPLVVLLVARRAAPLVVLLAVPRVERRAPPLPLEVLPLALLADRSAVTQATLQRARLVPPRVPDVRPSTTLTIN